jgi:hypothetical protein
MCGQSDDASFPIFLRLVLDVALHALADHAKCIDLRFAGELGHSRM